MANLEDLASKISLLESKLPTCSLSELSQLENQLRSLDEEWAHAVAALKSSGSSSSGGLPVSVLESLQSRWSVELKSLSSHACFMKTEAQLLASLWSDLFSQLLVPFSEDTAQDSDQQQAIDALIQCLQLSRSVFDVVNLCGSAADGWFSHLLLLTEWTQTPLTCRLSHQLQQLDQLAKSQPISTELRVKLRDALREASSIDRSYFSQLSERLHATKGSSAVLHDVFSDTLLQKLPTLHEIQARVLSSSYPTSFERSVSELIQALEQALNAGPAPTTPAPSSASASSIPGISSPSLSALSSPSSNASRSSTPFSLSDAPPGGEPSGSWTSISWSELSSVKKLGEGAFAVVYEALYAGERVAVKEIKYQEADAYAQHLVEVDMMSKLHSGYIVTMYGASIEKTKAFLAMEFLPNGALFDLIVHSGLELPWDRRWQLARDTTLGLHYLHTRKPPIVHRDFKSHNLLVDANGRVKICDFGLACPATPPPSGSCGTPRWLAPECSAGQPYTLAADIYSLGIVFWEIAARQVVWGYDRDEDIMSKVSAGKRPVIPADCDDKFGEMIQDCWHERPERRPSTEKLLKIFSKKGLLESKTSDDRKLLSELQTRCAKQSEEIEIHLQMRDQLQSRITSMERKMTEEGSEYSSLKRAAEDNKSRFEKERDRCAQLEKDADALKRELEQQKEAASRAEKKLSEKKRSTERDIRKIREDCDEKIERLETDLARAKRDCDREKRDKEGLEETIRNMTASR